MSVETEAEITSEEAAALAENIFGLWTAGGTMAQAMGLTDRECEAMYAMGHGFYAQGRYQDAFKIFAQLVAYNHLESRYQMGLASAMQATKRYEEALQQYMIVTVMRLDDPIPVYHCAECLLALGRPNEADESLSLVVGTLCKPGEHDALRSRAQELLKALRQKSKGG